MRALVLKEQHRPLELQEVPTPEPSDGEVLIRVEACGVCRTDLHIVDGDLPSPKLPLILGHQIVGIIEACGPSATHMKVGQRVGVPWLGTSCEACPYCTEGRENLCDKAQFTGYQRDGGFAEFAVAKEKYCIPLSSTGEATEMAPLLCAGLIGYRAYKLAGEGKRIGLYGFGAAAHILAQLATFQGKEVFAFTRPGDVKTQAFARSLGATWAGGSDEEPQLPLDAALIFAPVGALVPAALKAVKKGGSVICAGIHMSDIPSFPYSLLWGERTLASVANLTRADGKEFFKAIEKCPLKIHVTTYSLEEANDALDAIRTGKLEGAAVLIISELQKAL